MVIAEVEEEDEVEDVSLMAVISYAPCKECASLTADVCAACKRPMHFECGSIRDEEVISFCEDCCLVLGDVDHIPGRIAKRRELCARIGPIYGFTVADTNAWFA